MYNRMYATSGVYIPRKARMISINTAANRYNLTKISAAHHVSSNGIKFLFNSRAYIVKRLLLSVLLLVFTFLRLLMSLSLHMWYAPSQVADDQLLMSYTFPEVFFSVSHIRLAKNIGYSIWLLLVSKSGLNADIAYFIIWFLAALAMCYATYRFFRIKTLSIFTYLFVLWNPLAFEQWLGTRLYRNSLFAPLLFIFIASLLLFVTALSDKDKNTSSTAQNAIYTNQQDTNLDNGTKSLAKDALKLSGFALFSLCLGFLTFFIYIQKEDMIWIIPFFIFAIGLKLVRILRSNSYLSKKIITSLLCVMPIFTFYLGIHEYKKVNHDLFGVDLFNTRTEGELAAFAGLIQQIDTPDQTPTIWTPASSIEKVFSVSPTLKKYPQLLHDIEHIDFAAPDIKKNPLTGDFLTWQLRNAIKSSIGWTDERKIQTLFGTANKEIQQAFDSGKLRRTEKITLSPSLVPRTKSEILSLLIPSLQTYWLNYAPGREYVVSTQSNSPSNDPAGVNFAGLKKLNIDTSNPNPHYLGTFSAETARRIAAALVHCYTFLNIFLLCLQAFSLVYAVNQLLKSRCAYITYLVFSMCFLLYGFAYCFVSQWYAEYLNNSYTSFFYSAGCTTPFAITSLLFGLAYLLKTVLYQELKQAPPNSAF